MSTDTNATISKLLAIRSEMQFRIVAREEAIDALLCGLLSGHSLIIFGPRGTGKTTLVDALMQHLPDAIYFGTAMHPFKEPNELFGAIDIPALQKGRYRLNLSRMAVAHVAFLDETSRASDAALESLFDALEKRRVENEGVYHKMPLWFCIGAANAEFQGDRLGPLRDRFPIALYVNYVPDKDQAQLLDLYLNRPAYQTTGLTNDEVEELRALTKSVTIPDNIKSELLRLVNRLRNEGIAVSDRRWLNAIDVLRAYALINGRQQVDLADFQVLKFIFWDNQEEIPTLVDVLADIGNIWQQFSDLLQEAEGILTLLRWNKIEKIAEVVKTSIADKMQACVYTQRFVKSIRNTMTDMLPKVRAQNEEDARKAIERVDTILSDIQAILMVAIEEV